MLLVFLFTFVIVVFVCEVVEVVGVEGGAGFCEVEAFGCWRGRGSVWRPRALLLASCRP